METDRERIARIEERLDRLDAETALGRTRYHEMVNLINRVSLEAQLGILRHGTWWAIAGAVLAILLGGLVAWAVRR